ncbi:MAG: cyclase family protein [Bacillota bacterium]
MKSDMSLYPGTKEPIIEPINTFVADGFRESEITISSHTGTHIDAPAHMLEKGNYLADLDVEEFMGAATIIDLADKDISLIEIDHLKPYKQQIREVDFILLHTGWSNYWGAKQYYEDFPTLSEEAACWLAEFELKGIGVDAISIDVIDTTIFPVHKLLMSAEMSIIENLTNLAEIDSQYFTLSVMPLKYQSADASPVRAVAIENMF